MAHSSSLMTSSSRAAIRLIGRSWHHPCRPPYSLFSSKGQSTSPPRLPDILRCQMAQPRALGPKFAGFVLHHRDDGVIKCNTERLEVEVESTWVPVP